MKKIMFNDRFRLTEAVKKGAKTMTRRHVPEKVIVDGKVWAYSQMKYSDPHEALRAYIVSKAPYKVGDRIAIAQSYHQLEKEIEQLGLPLTLKEEKRKSAGYKNKMYVKADDMPDYIIITGVNAEHLQDISDEDCQKEGIYPLSDTSSFHKPKTVYTYIGGKLFDKPQWAFRSLFIKSGGKREYWEKNEWVYVYEFELVD